MGERLGRRKWLCEGNRGRLHNQPCLNPSVWSSLGLTFKTCLEMQTKPRSRRLPALHASHRPAHLQRRGQRLEAIFNRSNQYSVFAPCQHLEEPAGRRRWIQTAFKASNCPERPSPFRSPRRRRNYSQAVLRRHC